MACHGVMWVCLLQNVLILFLWTPDDQRQAYHALLWCASRVLVTQLKGVECVSQFNFADMEVH